MKVLVTGAAGFIGHHVARYLEEQECHEVTALVRCGKVGRLNRLRDVGFEGEVIWHDLRSPLVWGKNFDAVIHMAGETHVDRSIEHPAEFAMSNVVGTTHLLEWAIHHAGRFIQFSTDEVFGPALYEGAFPEDGAPHPKNPYAASKAGAEMMVEAFANTFGLRTVLVRGMNVFGERQHPEKWVPTIIRKVLRGEIITVHADPTKTKAGSRFYIYAGNVARALGFLLKKAQDGQVYHVRGEREVDNLEMVKQIAALMDAPNYIWQMVDFHSSRPGHDLRYAIQDNNLAALGWQAPLNFDESLKMTVEWYLANKEWL